VLRGLFLAVSPSFVQIFHPKLNNNFLTDTAWTVSVYIEAVAVLPQLFMFQAQGGEIEAFTSHWVFCIGGARVMHLAFWLSSYHELNDRLSSSAAAKYPGHIVVFSQVVQLALMLDFFYYYIKRSPFFGCCSATCGVLAADSWFGVALCCCSLKSGGPMMLPVSARMEV
jgi:hypothetical protein